MTAEQITTIITNVLSSGGVAVFLYMVIRGLKAQIGSLNKTIEVQQKTLEAMETRVLETEKVGNFYKQLFEELPNQVEKWKTVYTKQQEDLIQELEKAIQHKDEKLKESAEIELEKLKLQQRALDDVPELREELIAIVTALEQRLATVSLLTPIIPTGILSTLRSGGILRHSAHFSSTDFTGALPEHFSRPQPLPYPKSQTEPTRLEDNTDGIPDRD